MSGHYEDGNPVGPGIYADVPMSSYVADPCPEPSVSTSVVRALSDRSPLHAHTEHPRFGNQRDDSSRADLGSAAHAMLLGGAERIVVVDADDWRTNAAKNERDEARAAGKIPILTKDDAAVRAMWTKANECLGYHGFMDPLTEHTLIWRENGVWCRSRPDIMQTDHETVVDYKTATNADPLTWCKYVLFRGGYDLQAGLVLKGLDALVGQKERRFLFLVQEIEPPYSCSMIGCGPSVMANADQKVSAAIALWGDCLKSGKFPGYSREIHWAELPAWTQMEWAERQEAYIVRGNEG